MNITLNSTWNSLSSFGETLINRSDEIINTVTTTIQKYVPYNLLLFLLGMLVLVLVIIWIITKGRDWLEGGTNKTILFVVVAIFVLILVFIFRREIFGGIFV